MDLLTHTQRRKMAERILDFEKIGCFRVSLAPFKGAVDGVQTRSLPIHRALLTPVLSVVRVQIF